MLELISSGFKKAQEVLQGKTTLQESNIDDAIKEIRISMLEADVEFHVVKNFLDTVKDKAIGEIVQTRVTHAGKENKGNAGSAFHKDML